MPGHVVDFGHGKKEKTAEKAALVCNLIKRIG